MASFLVSMLDFWGAFTCLLHQISFGVEGERLWMAQFDGPFHAETNGFLFRLI